MPDPEATLIDSVSIDETYTNLSYGRVFENPKIWAFFLDATPGTANEALPYDQVLEMPLAKTKPVIINEFITVNRSSLSDEDGDFSDWIELYNPGRSPVSLDGYWLSDKEDNPFRWRFPEIVIEPDDYLIVFASGKNRSNPQGPYLHTTFRLNDRNDTLVLSKPDGRIIEKIDIRYMEDDVSYGRDISNPERWLYFPLPTPGQANKSKGFEEFDITGTPNLVINEVMAVNISTITDEDGEYADWIEIFNSEPLPVDLAGFGLSDKADDPFRWEFPEIIIGPGEHLVVFASGKDRRASEDGYLHTNFKIKPSGELISLHHPSGTLVDSMHSGKLGPDISSGRIAGQQEERFFFSSATPGAKNRAHYYSGYAGPVYISHPGGFYSNKLEIDMTAPAGGSEIRYTTDGSEPGSDSYLYQEPLLLEETSIIRARSYEEGKLPGPVNSRSFFIGEKHDLPVVSVLIDPIDLWDPIEGIYVKGHSASDELPFKGANFWADIEKPIHFQIFEPSGTQGLAMDAGIKIAGQDSRALDQKSFNVFFRNLYGYNEVRYPLFPRKELNSFKALTLRPSSEDQTFTLIRDIALTSLLEDTGLDYQDHHQAVLYLNGQYWGIYNIRERANRYMFAYNHDIDPDRIDMLQGNREVKAGSGKDYFDMLQFVLENDLSDPDNYQYIKERMDTTNYIDALIAQIYYAQTDPANIRFWREQSEEGRWRWLIYDLDWAFWHEHLQHNTLAAFFSPGGFARLDTTLARGLIKNDQFRQEFIYRFAYHLKYTFNSERVVGRIEELSDNIASEIPRQTERWGGSKDQWEFEVERMIKFARERPAVVIDHLQKYFNLTQEEMDKFLQ